MLKPATQTPLSALLLADLLTDAGLPPGWVNVVVGPAAEIGDVLVGDERVKLITFTGSSGVGWGIAERAARKRVKLELGNATPAIVCDDAPAGTASRLAANAFSFAGQSCISVQRIFVQEGAWDAFVPRFVDEVGGLKVGGAAHKQQPIPRLGRKRASARATARAASSRPLWRAGWGPRAQRAVAPRPRRLQERQSSLGLSARSRRATGARG